MQEIEFKFQFSVNCLHWLETDYFQTNIYHLHPMWPICASPLSYQKCFNSSRTVLYQSNIIISYILLYYPSPLFSKAFRESCPIRGLSFYRASNPLVAEQVLNFCLISKQQTSVTPAKVCTCIHAPTKPSLTAVKVIKRHLILHQPCVNNWEEANSRFLPS